MLTQPLAEEPPSAVNNVMDASSATAPLSDGGEEEGEGGGDNKNKSCEPYHRTNLKKTVGRGITAQSGPTLAQQVEHFPMLKGAPMVLQKPGGGATGNGNKESILNVTGLNFKPLVRS